MGVEGFGPQLTRFELVPNDFLDQSSGHFL